MKAFVKVALNPSWSAQLLRFALLQISLFLAPDLLASPTDSIIQRENAKPGTQDWIMPWQLVAPDRFYLTSTNATIEGYASLSSVNRGDSISFFVNTVDPTYTIEFFRLGWYGGLGARRMTQPVQIAGTSQPLPVPAADNTLLLECNWANPYTITIPTNAPDADGWVSGAYLAKLTAGTSHLQAYIPFIVRDDSRASTYLYQWACNTYQAYNDWAGFSFYSFYTNTSNTNLSGVPVKISFNRPYVQSQWNFSYESMMISFLESQGFDVSYCSSVDVHEQTNLLLTHSVFLSVKHDEYMSWSMRQNLEAARDTGVSLAFFGANDCYWQVRFEPSPLTAAPDRTLVCYKYKAARDPFANDGNPADAQYVTTYWRNNPVKPPEDALIGVLYSYEIAPTNVVICAPSHWVCASTGFTNGSALPNLLGYEIDVLGTNTPPGTVQIAHSPAVSNNGVPTYSDMTIYTAPSGADVFATGTIYWSEGLTPFPGVSSYYVHPNPGAQQMTLNVLTRLARCSGPQRGMISWWAGDGDGSDQLGRNPGVFPQGIAFTNGMSGLGFWFNGTNQYFVVTNAVTRPMITSQITFDAWLLPATLPGPIGIIFGCADSGGSPWCTISTAPDGILHVILTTTNTSGSYQTVYTSSVPVLAQGQIQHLAVTTDSSLGLTRAYVNATEVALALQQGTQPAVSNFFPNCSQIYIGGPPPNVSSNLNIGSPVTSNYYGGVVDEVGLYARVLSPDEVRSIYLARSGGRCDEEAQLTLTAIGNTNRLSWPLAALGYTLQSSAALTSGSWLTETNTRVVNGNRFTCEVVPATGQRFYRLIKTIR